MVAIQRTLANMVRLEKHYQFDRWKAYLRKSTQYLMHLKNQKIAEAVVSKTKHSYLNENTDKKWVFEAAPGRCFLTQQLLESGARKVRAFENCEHASTELNALKDKYGDRLELVDKQIIDFCNGNYKLVFPPRQTVIQECFFDIPTSDVWADKSTSSIDNPIVFYACLTPNISKEFLSYLVYCLSSFDVFFMNGPTEFYLFVPFYHFKQIQKKPGVDLKSYTAHNVLMNSLFDYNTVRLDENESSKDFQKIELDKEIHTAVHSSNFQHYGDKALKNEELFVLLRLKPKDIVFEYDHEFLVNYVNFVKQSYAKRSNLAVKYYEQHFPNSAIDLIGSEISYFKTLGELTSSEMLAIFKHFYDTPQYKTSIFNV